MQLYSMLIWFVRRPIRFQSGTSPWFSFCPQSKYKLAGKMEQQTGQFTTLPTTRDTIHAKDMGKLVSEVSLPHTSCLVRAGIQSWTSISRFLAQSEWDFPRLYSPEPFVTFDVFASAALSTETVQAEVWEGEGQVQVQQHESTSRCAARHGRSQESEQCKSVTFLFYKKTSVLYISYIKDIQ